MGIYIPGIETPNRHNYITVTIWPSGTASYGLFDRKSNLCDFKSIKVAHVPPHGRLIDADEPISLIDTRGQKVEVTVAHIIEKNQGIVKAIIPADPPKEEK